MFITKTNKIIQEETYIEREGKKLYIESNKGIGEIIKKIRGCDNKSKEKVKKIKNKKDVIDFDVINKEEIEDLQDDVQLIQTQLITGQYKAKVYYCSIDDGENFNYILKGPFRQENEMNSQLLSDIIKQKLLNSDSSYKSKKVKYGNEIYILYHNIIRIDKKNVVCKSSKLEENVNVYNGKKYFYSHEMINSLSKNEIIELIKVLAFRKVIGTNDTCVRNILYYDQHFYTIDDPVLLKTTQFMFKIHVEKYENVYNKLVKQNFKEIQKFLSEWEKIIRSSEDLPDNVKSFMFISEYMISENWKF